MSVSSVQFSSVTQLCPTLWVFHLNLKNQARKKKKKNRKQKGRKKQKPVTDDALRMEGASL